MGLIITEIHFVFMPNKLLFRLVLRTVVLKQYGMQYSNKFNI